MSSAYSLTPLHYEGLDIQPTLANNALRVMCWFGILGIVGAAIVKKYKQFKKLESKLTNMDNFDLMENEVKRKMVVHGGLSLASASFVAIVVFVSSINVFLST